MLDAPRLVVFFVFLASCSSIQGTAPTVFLNSSGGNRRSTAFDSSNILQSEQQRGIPFSGGPLIRKWGPLPEDALEKSIAVALRFFFELLETTAVYSEIPSERPIFLSGDLKVKPANPNEDIILRPGSRCPLVLEFSVQIPLAALENAQKGSALLKIFIFDEEKMKEAFQHSCNRLNNDQRFHAREPGKLYRLEKAWNQLWFKIGHEDGYVSVHLRDGDKEYSAILFHVPYVLSAFQRGQLTSKRKLKSFPQLTKSDVTACCPLCLKLQAVTEVVKLSREIVANRPTEGSLGRTRSFIQNVGTKILGWESIDNIRRRETDVKVRKTDELRKWLKDARFYPFGDEEHPLRRYYVAVSFVKDGVMAVVDLKNSRILHYNYDVDLPDCIKESPFVTLASVVMQCRARTRICKGEQLIFQKVLSFDGNNEPKI